MLAKDATCMYITALATVTLAEGGAQEVQNLVLPKAFQILKTSSDSLSLSLWS